MRLAVLALIAAIILGLAVPLINILTAPSLPDADLQTSGSDLGKAGPLAERLISACAHCHASEVPPPWYASLPGIGAMIELDRSLGLAALTLDGVLDNPALPLGEVAEAKLEAVFHTNEMPPARYLLAHWTSRLSREQRRAGLQWIQDLRRVRRGNVDLADAFRGEPVLPIPSPAFGDPNKIALGQRLYNDVRLSGDRTVSCATCHELAKGGTDQLPTSKGIRGQLGPINSPTVFNAVFNVRQFWDGRAADLQEQAAGPVTNPLEMDASWDQVTTDLSSDPVMVAAFTQVFGDGAVTQERVTSALAAFEETLLTPGAPFDRYLQGDETAITAEAQQGYRLFVERGCTSCHLGPGLGGTHFEKMGRHKDYFAARGTTITEADWGRFNATAKEADRHSFKVPLLRNLETTFPYLHDAKAPTIETAIEVMSTYQLAKPIPAAEQTLVAAFLRTLTAPVPPPATDALPTAESLLDSSGDAAGDASADPAMPPLTEEQSE